MLARLVVVVATNGALKAKTI